MNEPLSVRLDGPVHEWFSLSYAHYLVLPRLMLSQMPTDWQLRLVECLDELRDTFGQYHEDGRDNYTVQLRREGHFVADPLRDYRHGPELKDRAAHTEGEQA